MSYITNELKQYILESYKSIKKVEIGKSTNTDLTYSFIGGAYSSKNILFGNPSGDSIEATDIVFQIPKNGEPNLIVASNKDNLTFSPSNTKTKDGNTLYFNNYKDLFLTTPTSEQSGAIGYKGGGYTFNFLLIPSQKFDNLPTLNVASTSKTIFINGVLDYTIYFDVFNQHGSATDGFNYANVKVDLSGHGSANFLLIPKEILEHGMSSGHAYDIASSKNLEVTYRISDFYSGTPPMVFDEASNIKVNSLKVELKEN